MLSSWHLRMRIRGVVKVTEDQKSTDKKINLGFRVSEQRQEELKIISAKRRQSIQQMLEDGLEILLTGGTVQAAASESSMIAIRPDNRHWHQVLERVLAGPERVGITENLRWADMHRSATRGLKVVDQEAERRDQEFGELIASMEILRDYQPKTTREREALAKISAHIRSLVDDAGEDAARSVDKNKKMK